MGPRWGEAPGMGTPGVTPGRGGCAGAGVRPPEVRSAVREGGPVLSPGPGGLTQATDTGQLGNRTFKPCVRRPRGSAGQVEKWN